MFCTFYHLFEGTVSFVEKKYSGAIYMVFPKCNCSSLAEYLVLSLLATTINYDDTAQKIIKKNLLSCFLQYRQNVIVKLL